ncbi:hypothetical protein D9611_010906 [Ephemerocybe angulata]|uniref:Uncharacterized protein n=1 Tax=Ephemerocybe angulata TaxID=980116 RepID=A0A8H5C6Y6_9AGAR|nr:hypothetical protein D9611_010906 [Tulosesus angulatus]
MLRSAGYISLSRPRSLGSLKATVVFFSSLVLLFFFTYLYARRAQADWARHRTGPLTPISLLNETTGKVDLWGTCSPEEYAQGQWVRRPYWTRPSPLTRTNTSEQIYRDLLHGAHGPEKLTSKEDILKFARMEGCASDGEDIWNQFAVTNEEQWDRFPKALEWEWIPGGRCTGKSGLRDWDLEGFLRDLVEGGGWLLIGGRVPFLRAYASVIDTNPDSITGNHFFSISCLLYPHVVIGKSTSYERDRLQSLYLDPSSPFAGRFQLPEGFNIKTTPLVSFKRVDLLWSVNDLASMHKALHPEFYSPSNSFKLFGDTAVWTVSPEVYLNIFLGPVATANYKTMIVSSAGHWTMDLFHGYHRAHGSDGSTLNDSRLLFPSDFEELEPILGYDGLLIFFREAMEHWANAVQRRLDTHPPSVSSSPTRQRQVLVRAYLAGHDACHNARDPWAEERPPRASWNWREIGRFNKIWEERPRLAFTKMSISLELIGQETYDPMAT